MSRLCGLLAVLLSLTLPGGAYDYVEPLNEGRRGAAAVFIGDSLILIGGRSWGRPFDSVLGMTAPDQLHWKSFPPLKEARANLAVAAVGRSIYAVGGEDGDRLLSSVERLDLGADRWESLPPLATTRTGASAFALDGKIYVAGGRGPSGFLSDVTSYDRWRRRWVEHARLPVPTSFAASAELSGEGWVIGGLCRRGGKDVVTDAVWIYDRKTDMWRHGPPLPLPRESARAAVVRGTLYVVGGRGADGHPLARIDSYDPAHRTWSPIPNQMQAALAEAAVAGHTADRAEAAFSGTGDKLVVIGGWDGKSQGSGDVSIYFPRARSWTLYGSAAGNDYDDTLKRNMALRVLRLADPVGVDDLPAETALTLPRSQAAAVQYEGATLLIGGRSNGRFLNFVERLEPDGLHWTPMSPLRRARAGHGAAVFGDKIFVVGGTDQGGVMDSVEIFDKDSQDWHPGPPLRHARAWAAFGASGKKLCAVGGMGRDGPLNDIECFDGKSWDFITKVEPLTEKLFKDPRESPLVGASVASYPRGAPYGDEHVLLALGGSVFAGGRLAATGQLVGFKDMNEGEMTFVNHGVALTTPRSEAAAALESDPRSKSQANRVFVAGGKDSDDKPRSTLEIYELNGGYLTVAAPMPTARAGASAFFHQGRLYVVGGHGADGKDLDVVETYDPGSNRWAQVPAQARMPSIADVPSLPVPARKPRRPHDVAIVIGIDNYKILPPASFGEADAKDFAHHLEALGLVKENIVTLTGARAGRIELSKYIDEWLPRHVNEDSRVYIVFSGHGAPDPAEGTSFLVPWDGDPSFLRTTGYPLKALYEHLDALPVKSVVVILDSCFSGTGPRSVIAKGMRPLVQLKGLRQDWQKLTILTASAPEQIAGSLQDQKHGLFSFYVLEGLRGAADQDGNGHVTVEELYEYVRGHVVPESRRQGREQVPTLSTRTPKLRLY